MNTERTLPSKAEQIAARMLYNWIIIVWLLLFIASCLAFALPIDSTLGLAMAWGIQVLAILALALGFLSPSSFVRWHTAQAIGLGLIPSIAGGAGGAFVSPSLDLAVYPIACSFFLLPIVAFVGIRQTRRGDCGLQRIVGDIVTAIHVLRPASQVSALEAPPPDPGELFARGNQLIEQGQRTEGLELLLAASRQGDAQLQKQVATRLAQLVEPIAPPVESPLPETPFERGLAHLGRGERDQAIQVFTAVYANESDPALRQKALEQLEALGAVKKF